MDVTQIGRPFNTIPPTHRGPDKLDPLESMTAEGLFRRIRQLLGICGRPRVCDRCGEPIWFLRTRRDKFAAFSVHGVKHHLTCAGHIRLNAAMKRQGDASAGPAAVASPERNGRLPQASGEDESFADDRSNGRRSEPRHRC